MNYNFWSDKVVLLTGHTGFKGGWTAQCLAKLGAVVHGVSLAPPTVPNFYSATKLEDLLGTSTIADIRDLKSLKEIISKTAPDVIFHMAAQPLVRYSYENPIDTFETNVLGTVNVLEAARGISKPCAIINITTDKCYENMEWDWPYRENDPLGGQDPYSSSKACADIAAAAYSMSFLRKEKIYLANARAGNVIGGGDWATDRLLPDFLRSLQTKNKFIVRSPNAIRPWQHVLEPVFGYLLLAEKLHSDGEHFASAWNFGPKNDDAVTVEQIVKYLSELNPTLEVEFALPDEFHEASTLKLDSSKATMRLGWRPRWDIKTALSKTLEWHQNWLNQADMRKVTDRHIEDYLGHESL